MSSPHSAVVAPLLVSTSVALTTSMAEAQIKSNAVGTGTNSKDGRAIELINAAAY